MITISYDETTGFEASKNERNGRKDPVMIAGFVYEDESDDLERERICAYLKTMCNEQGVSFPRDLHSNGGNRNGERVGKLKEQMNATLPEFIKHGTFKGAPLHNQKTGAEIPKRTGRYQVIILEKKSRGDNRVAGKLYADMAEKFICKAVFQNLTYFKQYDNRVFFNVPTRVIDDNTLCQEDKDVLGQQGFAYKPSQRIWSIVDNGTVREWIKTHNKENTCGQKVLSVTEDGGSKIFTNPMKEGYNNAPRVTEFAFMFLADSLCAYLKNILTCQINDIAKGEIREITEKELETLRLQGGNEPDIVILQTLLEDLDSDNFSDGKIPGKNSVDSAKAKKVLKDAHSTMLRKSYEEDYGRLLGKGLKNLCPDEEHGKFYYFDEVDDYYDRAILEAEQGNLFEALSNIYDGRQVEGDVKQYYEENLFPKLEDFLIARSDYAMFAHAIKDTNEHRLKNNISPGKLLYVFQMLEKLAGKLQGEIDGADLFYLYDIGVSAYVHVGDYVNAEKCFYRCFPDKEENYVANPDSPQPYECVAKEEDRVLVKNRMITVFNDKFDYKTAEKLAEEMLSGSVSEEGKDVINEDSANDLLGSLRKVFKRFEKNEETKGGSLLERLVPPKMQETSYKVWSSLGQVCAFENAKEAEECFKRVLEVLAKKKKDGNYYITLSYLLHWYIECGDRNGYEKWAKEYFGGYETPEEQLDYLIKEGVKGAAARFSFRYALFVFVKAFYKFYRDEKSHSDLRGLLADMEKEGSVKSQVRKLYDGEDLFAEHPWEIIYKYAALMALDEGNKNKARENIEKSKDMVKDSGFTVDRVIEFGEIEYLERKLQDSPKNEKLRGEYENKVNEIWKNMVDYEAVEEPAESVSEKMAVLRTKLTYMYH